jgi:outer membrane protein OmpA-like peptidoglycan-associated protein
MPVDMWTIGFADRCAFAHIPTGTAANNSIDVDEGEDRSDVITVVPAAIGAGTEIGRATP